MERRTCVGKPDGSPCAAPAMRGSAHCRHHQARPSKGLYRRGGRQCLSMEFFITRAARPELETYAYASRGLADEMIMTLVGAGVARAIGLPPDEADRIQVPNDLPRRVRGILARASLRALKESPREIDPVPVSVEISWPAAVPIPGEALTDQSPHPIRLAPVVEAPNHGADRDIRKALARAQSPDAWPRDDTSGHRSYQGEQTTVVFKPPELFAPNWYLDEIREATSAALDSRFVAMRGDLVADVADILFLHWLENGKPPKAKITLSQLLAYRNVGQERKNKELHWRAMRDARSIRLMDANIDVALFDMDAIRLPQTNLFGMDEPPPADYVFVYAPGYFVGRAVGSTGVYLAAYTPRVLQLDPHNYSLAKRLARYLRGEWRMNPGAYLQKDPRSYRTWRAHLDDAGIDPKTVWHGRPCQRSA